MGKPSGVQLHHDSGSKAAGGNLAHVKNTFQRHVCLLCPQILKVEVQLRLKKLNLKLNVIHLKPTSYRIQDFGFSSMGTEPLAIRCRLVE